MSVLHTLIQANGCDYHVNTPKLFHRIQSPNFKYALHMVTQSIKKIDDNESFTLFKSQRGLIGMIMV